MKRILSLFMVLAVCFSLCSCGANNQSTEPETEISTVLETEINTEIKTEANKETAAATETAAEAKTETATEAKTEERTEARTEAKTEAITGCKHRWNNATCLAPKICTVCYVTEGSIGDHSYNSATCTSPKKCKYCGQTSGKALDCVPNANGDCIYCGKETISLSNVLSAPMDSMREITSFVSSYYNDGYYTLGNYRLIFNSADGIILAWGATNTSKKDIKYITFTIEYYNNVGDPAYDEISGKNTYTARLTGPIGAGNSFYFRRLIGYGSDIMYGTITDVKVEFMDGTSVSGNYGYTTWHNIRTAGSPKECFIIEK